MRNERRSGLPFVPATEPASAPTMTMETANRIDGQSLADDRLNDVRQRSEGLPRSPRLHVITAVSDDATRSYIRQKSTSAGRVGIETRVHDFSEDSRPEDALETIRELNNDPRADGIIVQLPLPEGWPESRLLEAVDPARDVDGLHPYNFGRLLSGEDPLFIPPTPLGILSMLSAYDVDLSGLHAALVGMGRLVGRPLSQELLNRDATVVCLHKMSREVRAETRRAQLIVAAAGVPRLIGPDHVSDGTIVIDAGIHRMGDELVGDVDFEPVAEKARLITPVPGGVGPMTVACLLSNTVKSSERRQQN